MLPQRPAAAAARRLDPGGRARARRRAHARRPGQARRRAEGDRRERRALAAPARPGAARTTRRGRHPRVAGHRPGRRRGQLVLDHAARCCAKPSSRRARPRLAAALHPSIFAWNLVDEVAGNGRNARRGQPTCRRSRAGCTQHDPTRMVAVDVWGDHPPRARRRDLLEASTRSPRPTTPAGMTPAGHTRAASARDARAPARAGADVRRQGAA